MPKNLLRSVVTALLVGASATAARAAVITTSVPVGPITFDTPADYTNNFREFYDNGAKLNQSGGVLAQTAGANTDNGIAIYDQTPADATDVNVFASPFRVTFTGRAAVAASSIGVILIDPADNNNNVIALFNFDVGGVTTADTIRFFKDGPINTTQTSVGTQVGATVTGDAGVDGNSTFTNFTLDYSVSGTTPTLKLTVGSLSATSAFSAGDAIASPQLAFRLFDATNAAGSTDIDNVTVTAVPEPASAGLVALAGLPALFRRGRRRRA
jgi:hypothetical protein